MALDILQIRSLYTPYSAYLRGTISQEDTKEDYAIERVYRRFSRIRSSRCWSLVGYPNYYWPHFTSDPNSFDSLPFPLNPKP